MHLKSLELNGFKSFLGKTNLNFDKGITGIVGPNGSGKSNVSDAVRWVMGESSAKSLRSSKMEDVIFAGTQTKKPVSFAEVSITIDNSDNALPVEFSEVVVSRRVNRLGDSEYRINRSLCRLKDVHSLFMDTGLGRDGYSIIGQGRIDEVLSAKSDERRAIFEEAAGISKYRYRKQEAEKKLSMAALNLEQIENIISEVEARIEPLYQQSQKAEKYINLSDKLKILDVNVSLCTIENNKAVLSDIKYNQELIERDLCSAENTITNLENTISNTYEKIQFNQRDVDFNRELVEENSSAKSSLQNQISISKTNMDNNNRLYARLIEDTNNLNERIDNFKIQIETLSADENESQLKSDSVSEGLNELSVQQQLLDEKIRQYNAIMGESQATSIELLNAVANNKARVSGFGLIKDNFTSRQTQISSEIAEKTTRLENSSSENIPLAKEIEDISSQKTNLMSEIKKTDQNISELIEKHQHSLEISREHSEIEHKLISRKNILSELLQEGEGYVKSVKTVLRQANAGNLSGIVNTVAGVITPKKEYVTAIEVCATSALNNIITLDDNSAKQAVNYLKMNNLGRATFMPLTSVKAQEMYGSEGIKKHKGFLCFANEAVEFDKRYEGIIKSILARTIIADNIDNALAMAKAQAYKVRIVTLDGQLLNPGGSITGGSVQKNSYSPLSQKIELQDIEDALNGAHDKAKKSKDEYFLCAKELERVKIKKERLGGELSTVSDSLVRKNTQYELISNAQKTLKDEISSLKNEISSIVEDLIHIANEEDSLCIKIMEDEKAIELINNTSSAHQGDFQKLTDQRQAISEEINLLNIEKSKFLMEIGHINQRRSDLNVQLSQALSNRGNNIEELNKIQKENIALKTQVDEFSGDIIEIEQCVLAANDKIQRLNGEKDILSKKIQPTNDEIHQNRQIISVLTTDRNKLESRRIKAELEYESAINSLWENYELTFSTAISIKINGFVPSENMAEIASLKNQIKSLGSVNLDSINEYTAVTERFAFLSSQKDDLVISSDSLQKLIGEVTETMKKQFLTEFKNINVKFGIVFAKLFGGGAATLEIENMDEILESGIGIKVQPPGKKLQSLELLSGGERAFTAISLLFAILEVRPTPFCILDEIDAALDDVNVARFSAYLKEYKQDVQFVMVTHRRGTMEVCDKLYGVTMEEKGISCVLTLDFNDVREYN